jgi:hypothetical protein
VQLNATDAKLVGVARNGRHTERNSTWEECGSGQCEVARGCVLPMGNQRTGV